MPAIKKWGPHRGPLIDTVKNFDVIDCEICGFKHLIPIETDIVTYYPEKFIKQRPALLEFMKEDLEWWEIVHTEKYEYFEKILESKGKLLDIGCGMGYFLKVGKERGWDVLGVEPSKQSFENAHSLGVPVINKSFNKELASQLENYTVIHMHEVLEHLPYPLEVIKICKDLIEPSGLLSITVPNDYNVFQTLLKDKMGFKPWWVSPGVHLNYFDINTLQSLFERNGFEVLIKTTSFPLEIFILMGDNYIENNTLGRICHTKRKFFELNLQKNGMGEFRKEIYSKFAELGIGREITMIGRKKVES